jgi:hypothetical protein
MLSSVFSTPQLFLLFSKNLPEEWHAGLVFLFSKNSSTPTNVRKVIQMSSVPLSKTSTACTHGKLLPARSKQNPIPHLHSSNISCLKTLKPPHVAFPDWLFENLWSLSWYSILSLKCYQKHSLDKTNVCYGFLLPKTWIEVAHVYAVLPSTSQNEIRHMHVNDRHV